MWVVRGPFDGDEGQDSSTERPKLLKPGKRYVLGRKDASLLIPNKKISREHVTFNLSEFPTSQVDNPTFKPKVRLQNPRNKPITIQRGINLITLDPSSSTELWDGDAIHLVGGITVVISWYPLCCRSPATVPANKESCANIGVHVVHSLCPEVTHNVIQELTLTPSCVLSLLKSKVVTPEWLAEVIRRGTEGNPGSVLEQHFELPDTSSYLPAVSTASPSTLSPTDFWTANATRYRVLDDRRFIVFTRGSEKVEDFQSVISASGGGYELFPVDSGRIRLHRRLSVDKDRRQKVIVVDNEVKASVTPDTWNELIDEAKSFKLTFCSREQVLETIVVGEPSTSSHYPTLRVTEVSSQSHQGDSLEGHFEGSLRSKRLIRRTTPSPHPSLDQERPSEVEQSQVRRVLTRRVKGGSVPPAADDSGGLNESHCVGEDPAPPTGIDVNMSLLPRPSRPLKRRAGTAALQSMDELGTPSIEPPLKRFKALFEESDPDRLTLSLPSESLGVMQEYRLQPSSTPTDSQPGKEGHLHIVEGDEVSQDHAAMESRGTKRRAGTEDTEDDHVFSTLAEHERSARPLKRRAVGRASTTIAEAHSQTYGGANFGKPDMDKRFLTALASMKKGKKNEDSFDREFNDLRISKPDIEREVQEQGWDLLDGLDDEHNVRGNFMLVVELDVYKKDGSAGRGTLRAGRIDWEGKPDFKKFRRKTDPRRRPTVELMLNQGNDYGVGSVYWKDDPDPAQADEFLGHSQASSKARALQLQIEDSGDEDQFPVKPSREASKRTTKGKIQGSRQETSEPLFLNSEDEEVAEVTKHGEGDDQDEGTETLRSTGSSRKSRVKQAQAKRVVVVVEDDSDDGTTFKGFGTKQPSRR
ncbi:hypothetical protein BDM02DRAFT_3267528 [Thelephora ganbajun]|uniref:Uncharacterized protein n=1 Tax=Thelephora ganbajun TaxID=370292 RepID=A0ACB6ZMW0_THEGA|nr:hypothetical protein BDM02DRAFT_3267528 [Thelephora ganbajun]